MTRRIVIIALAGISVCLVIIGIVVMAIVGNVK